MLNAFCFLFGFQLIGTALGYFLGLPVPGPVIGLMLMLVWLLVRLPRPAALEDLLGPFMGFLPLFFVPAVVGIIQHLDKISPYAMELGIVITISTLLSLVSSVVVFIIVAAKTAPASDEELKK